jgi:hypothetical protein
MKNVRYIAYTLFLFCAVACHPKTEAQQEERSSTSASTEPIPSVIKRIANELPLSDTGASTFFTKLDSAVIKKDDYSSKQKIECKRYSIYYTTDSARIASVWIDLNPEYELTMGQLDETFKTDWKPVPSNAIDIKTEDAVVHKKYTYSTAKGMIDITTYSRYDKITGILLEFRNKL